jgi:hypothetical protein
LENFSAILHRPQARLLELVLELVLDVEEQQHGRDLGLGASGVAGIQLHGNTP